MSLNLQSSLSIFCVFAFSIGSYGSVVHAQQASDSLWTRSRGVDWPTFLGPTSDGKSSETGILTDWSDGKLKLLWKVETGEGYGIGSVSHGRFYHFGKTAGEAKLVCLNAETGKELWSFGYDSQYQDLYGYDSGPRASPVVDGKRVYIYGVEGLVHCLDAHTGDMIWKQDLNEKFGVIQNFFGVASTPVVFEDLLILMVGGSPDESKKVPPGALDRVKSNGTGIIALDKRSGEFKYSTVDDLASYASLRIAELNGKPTLLAWMRGAFYCVEPATGREVSKFPWRSRKLESVNASTPVSLKDNHLLISECYEIGSALLKAEGGRLDSKWEDRGKRDKALEAHWNTPVWFGDAIYGCSGRHSAPAELRCVDWKSGEVLWTQKGLSRSSLTYVDGHFVVLGERGDLLLIKATPKKFELVTKYSPGEGDNGIEFKSPCWAAPIISHGLLYVRGKSQMACFELIPENN